MRPNLLQWQWSLYLEGHRDRRNLLLHALTVPSFITGTLTLLSAIALPRLAVAGVILMVVALVAQGRGHKLEVARPVPFLGAGDFITRFFAEQFVTFPRYVLSGEFAKAWARAGEAAVVPTKR